MRKIVFFHNLFRLKEETKAFKNSILRDIKNPFEHEEGEENYYKLVKVSTFWSNNYIEYKSNGDRNKTLSVEEYLSKDINNLKKSVTWKIELTIPNNFISSIDNDEGRVMHSKSDNIEIMINDEADEVKKNFLIHLKVDIKIIWNRSKVASFSLSMSIYCIINVIN